MKWLIALFLVVNLNGCVSGMVQDAIDAADEHVRLKWAEEWKPALEKEVAESLSGSKDYILERALTAVEGQEERLVARLDQLNIKMEDFDEDKDGLVTDSEVLVMINELRQAKDADGKPLGWYEILMAVVLGYGGTTAGKELIKSKIKKGTGSGTSVAA